MEQLLKPRLQARGLNPPRWLGAVLFTLVQLQLADMFFFPSLQVSFPRPRPQTLLSTCLPCMVQLGSRSPSWWAVRSAHCMRG